MRKEKGDLIKVTGKKVERWDLQCSWCCRTEGGWAGRGERFLRQKLIYVSCQLVCVYVCVCERFNSPPHKVCKKYPGDPNCMDLLV